MLRRYSSRFRGIMSNMHVHTEELIALFHAVSQKRVFVGTLGVR